MSDNLKSGLHSLRKGIRSLPIPYPLKQWAWRVLSRHAPSILYATGTKKRLILKPEHLLEPTTPIPLPNIEDPIRFAAGLSFPAHEQPLVSILISVYGHLDYTLYCLHSIQEHLPAFPIEIILVDDCSPDQSAKILASIPGIRLFKNAENQGFIKSNNFAAKQARGEYLHFLNNDTVVSHGWLDALVMTFHDFPGTGLAGSKLVYPNGILQEAGSIIWANGGATNYGKHQDPNHPNYNYAREVDYCSGASILIPRTLFLALGGFDVHYLPAYCEDTDFALQLREKGYRVLYQPLSLVYHFEGTTSGRDVQQGVKAYQIDNLKKLFDRWQHRLSKHPLPDVGWDNACDRRATRRVLVIDYHTPTPDQDAGSVYALNIMLLLREMNFHVTFIPEATFSRTPIYTPAIQRLGIQALYKPYIQSVASHLAEAGAQYTLVLLIRPMVVQRYLPSIRKYCKKAKVLYLTQDIHHIRLNQEAKILENTAKQYEAREMQQIERSNLLKVDAGLVVSTAELDTMRAEIPNAKIHLFPLINEIPPSVTAFEARRDLVFVGGYAHSPNVDAVLYFVQEVMPLVRLRLPGVKLHLIGSHPTPEILQLATTDIIVTGHVPALNDTLNTMHVFVCPLRFGSGIKGKIVHALALGLPVVATTNSVEGMPVQHNQHVLVADSPEEMAKAIFTLYTDETRWNQLRQHGIKLAQDQWGIDAAYRNLAEILETLGIANSKPTYQLSAYSEPYFLYCKSYVNHGRIPLS